MRMPTYKARYRVVRELREMKRLTQEDVWEQAGVAQGTYQAMESKKAYHEGREFKEANLVAVATLLGASLPDIAHGIPEAKAARWLWKSSVKNVGLRTKEFTRPIFYRGC